MSVSAMCTMTCTTPYHGLVESGEIKQFPFSEFDVGKYKYLKHFEELPILFLEDDPVEAGVKK